MTALDTSSYPSIFTEGEELPNLWAKARIASGPLKLTVGGDNKSISSALLQFIQGVHNTASGYEFFVVDMSTVLVYKNGDYVGKLRIGYPSYNATRAGYIVQSRNVVGKKGRGYLANNETYSYSVEKAVSLASGLFTRPKAGELVREIRSYLNPIVESIKGTCRSGLVNTYAERFYTALRVTTHGSYDTEDTLKYLQGKTLFLRAAALLAQAYRQRQGDVPWDTHDENLDMDSLVRDIHDALTTTIDWKMDEFLNLLDMYKEGSGLRQRLEKEGYFVLINTIGDIHCMDIGGMNFPIGNPPSMERQATAYQFYRKGMECATFPPALRDALHTLYSIGVMQYVKNVGVMLTDPKLPAYIQHENFRLGSLFYVESCVLPR